MKSLPVSLAALPFVILITSAALAQEPQRDVRREPVVTTTGSAMVQRVPDRAHVRAATEARAAAPKEAQAQNAKAMTSVREKLKAIGIADSAIETISIELQPEFDYVSGRQKLRGYLARNVIEVRLDDLARVGEVIDSVVGAGATSVHDVRFDLKDRAAAEREALKAAVADARGRAEALAAGAGLAIDRIVTIEEHRQDSFPPPRPMMMARADAAESQPTPVTPGQIEIRASVTLTATIK
jgi:uncharacterized protein YggE